MAIMVDYRADHHRGFIDGRIQTNDRPIRELFFGYLAPLVVERALGRPRRCRRWCRRGFDTGAGTVGAGDSVLLVAGARAIDGAAVVGRLDLV